MLINGIEITKALIVAQPWVGYMFEGIKTWEMRSSDAKHRGWFGIIEKGTGLIVGIAHLDGTILKLTKEELIENRDKHQVDYESEPDLLKWNNAWVLSGIQRVNPVKYKHKQGAVIWVKLDD